MAAAPLCAVMVLVYRGGPYARQDDYLVPLPNLIPVAGGMGYYRRTAETDPAGRVIYDWIVKISDSETRRRAIAS